MSVSPADKSQLSKLEYGQSTAMIHLKGFDGKPRPVGLVMRVSYVGELGYELHMSSAAGESVTSVFDSLMKSEEVALAGFEALDAMSLEKGK